MAELGFTVRAQGAVDLDGLIARLDHAAHALPDRLTQALRQDAPSAVAQVRSAWLGVDVTSSRGGGSSSGLRARVAAATTAEDIPGGVSFPVDGSAVDGAYGRSLAWYLNGTGRWRHPVHGHTERWVQQSAGPRDGFFRTLHARRSTWESGLEQVIDQVTREIEG